MQVDNNARTGGSVAGESALIVVGLLSLKMRQSQVPALQGKHLLLLLLLLLQMGNRKCQKLYSPSKDLAFWTFAEDFKIVRARHKRKNPSAFIRSFCDLQ